MRVKAVRRLRELTTFDADALSRVEGVRVTVDEVKLFKSVLSLMRVELVDDTDSECVVGWILNNQYHACMRCNAPFGSMLWIHHCRLCGYLVCSRCSRTQMKLDKLRFGEQTSRVCIDCVSHVRLKLWGISTVEEDILDHRDFDQDQQKVAVESSKAGPTYNSESKTKGTQEANQSADVIQDGDIDETAALLFAGTPHEDQQVDIGVDSEEKVADHLHIPLCSSNDPMCTTAATLTAQNTIENLTITELRGMLSARANELLSDSDCLRFLRARDHNAKKAADMIHHWEDWWHTPLPGTGTGTDAGNGTGTDAGNGAGSGRESEKSNLAVRPKDSARVADPNEHVYQHLLPHSNLGETKEGLPVYWEKTGLISSRFHKVKKILSEDELFNRHVRQQELMIERMRKSSQRHGREIEKQVLVFDLKGIAMTVDLMAMRVFRRTLQIDEACYPERLHKLIMINAPSTFTFLWSMIKPWLDPVTATKIQIVGTKYQAILKDEIAVENIPVEYGGTREDFHWQYPENLEL